MLFNYRIRINFKITVHEVYIELRFHLSRNFFIVTFFITTLKIFVIHELTVRMAYGNSRFSSLSHFF